MLSAIFNFFKVLASKRDAEGYLGKSWYRSKTLWVNIIALVGVLTAHYLKVEMPEETVVAALAVVNFILRLATHEPTGFLDEGGKP